MGWEGWGEGGTHTNLDHAFMNIEGRSFWEKRRRLSPRFICLSASYGDRDEITREGKPLTPICMCIHIMHIYIYI